VVVHAQLRLELPLPETRRLQRAVDDARRTAETEENRIRPALNLDVLRVVSIERDVRREKVARDVRAAEAADAIPALRIAQIASLAPRSVLAEIDAGVVAVDAVDLGVRRVNEQVAQIRRTGVAHELRRHDADRRSDIAQVGLQATA